MPMTTWMIIVLAWLAVGLLSYAVILRWFPPTPFIIPRRHDAWAEELASRPFSLRDLPQMVIILIPTAVVSPLFLLFLVGCKLRKPKNGGSK